MSSGNILVKLCSCLCPPETPEVDSRQRANNLSSNGNQDGALQGKPITPLGHSESSQLEAQADLRFQQPQSSAQSSNQISSMTKNLLWMSGINGLGMKSLAVQSEQSANTEFQDTSAGEDCTICMSRPKTHYILPCGHASCLPCWTKWLFPNYPALQEVKSLDALYAAVSSSPPGVKAKRVKLPFGQVCFVCHKEVKGLKRFPISKVPQDIYEEEADLHQGGNKRQFSTKQESEEDSIIRSLKELELDLDKGLEDVLHALVTVKDELATNVLDKLKEVQNHVMGLNTGGSVLAALSEETATVLAVECQTVNEALASYADVFQLLQKKGKHRNVASMWQTLEHNTQTFKSLVEALDVMIQSGALAMLSEPAAVAVRKESHGEEGKAKKPNESREKDRAEEEEVDSVTTSVAHSDDEETTQKEKSKNKRKKLKQKTKVNTTKEVSVPVSVITTVNLAEDIAVGAGNETKQKMVTSLREIYATLELCMARTAISAQWNKIKGILQELSLESELIQSTLAVFRGNGSHVVGFIDENNLMLTVTLAEAKAIELRNSLTQLLQDKVPMVATTIMSITEDL